MSELLAHPSFCAPEGPLYLVIMDGVGLGDGGHGDAVAQAKTPTLDWLRGLPSATSLLAHGTAVGMPSDGDMGNSEVGHNAIGAGRLINQGAKLVANAISSGSLFEGAVWQQAIAQVQRSGQALHFLGLLSDGNVHSHIDHLVAMLDRAARAGCQKIRVHTLLDGRDVPARSALVYIEQLERVLAKLQSQGIDARIASGGGRMHITMDRYEADWDMVARGWSLHVHGKGRMFASAAEAVQTLYDETGEGDQYLPGFVIADATSGEACGPINDGAAVILFNFRGDRAIEISRAFAEDESFTAFDRGRCPDVLFAGMMQYDGDLGLPKQFLVDPPQIERSFGELLARQGRRQLALSETFKFGHVTYFFNGNRSAPFAPELETYLEVPSDTRPLPQRPWMRATEVTDLLVDTLDRQGPDHAPDLIRLNYANGDMVGHTGDLAASIVAVEAVDICLRRLVADVKRRRGILLVTADHGNADQMFDRKRDGSYQVRTSHSLNRVPFSIYDPRLPAGGPTLRPPADAGLTHIAATCLELLGFQAPADYRPSLLAPRS